MSDRDAFRANREPLDPSWTYRPDETECRYGHRFTSEADCFLPEDWDHFMCRKCIAEAGLTEAEVARSLEAW